MEHGNGEMYFCKFCGAKIPADAVICTSCGRQVAVIKSEAVQQHAQQPNIIINNANSNVNTNQNNMGMYAYGRRKNKWTAVLLCLFLGVIGAHRFYEGKIGTGILYLFTAGLLGIGVLIDLIILLCKPNPYYV